MAAGRRHTASARAAIAQAYAECAESIIEIGARFRVDPTSVGQIAKSLGVPRRRHYIFPGRRDVLRPPPAVDADGRRKWDYANPDKRRAHKTVWNALRSGALVRGPCAQCGTTIRIEAHHEDYSKPRDVIWLCRMHHVERHVVKRREPVPLEVVHALI